MTEEKGESDPIMDLHRRIGRDLAEAAFAKWKVAATEDKIFALERDAHPAVERFMRNLNATDENTLHAKLVVGSALRAHYQLLCIRYEQHVQRVH